MLLQSKGGILSKACEYIKELRQNNMKLAEEVGVLDRLRVDNQLLRQEVSEGIPTLTSDALPNSRPNLGHEVCCPTFISMYACAIH